MQIKHGFRRHPSRIVCVKRSSIDPTGKQRDVRQAVDRGERTPYSVSVRRNGSHVALN
jgi:hypothetical protein